MKRVFICSPYRGNIALNTVTAERLCRKAVKKGFAPFAPHLLYTRFLSDVRASEREAGIACGLTFMETCDEVWVYTGNGVSEGMRREIDHAVSLNKTIIISSDIDMLP